MNDFKIITRFNCACSMRQTCEYKFLIANFCAWPSQASCFRSSYQHLTRMLPPAFHPPGVDASSFAAFERSQFVGRGSTRYFATIPFLQPLLSQLLHSSSGCFFRLPFLLFPRFSLVTFDICLYVSYCYSCSTHSESSRHGQA